MKINISTFFVDHKITASVFDSRLATKLLQHLNADLYLDDSRIARIMPVLKRTFILGFKDFLTAFEFDNARQKSATHPPLLKDDMHAISQACADVAMQAYESLLMALADQLARQDELIYPRSTH